MRVALITDGIYPYVIGGMQKHSFYLAKYLAKHNIYVDLFHFNSSHLNINTLDCFDDDEKKFIHSIVIPFPKSIKFPGHYLYNSYRYSNLVYEKIKPLLSDYDFIYTKGFTGWKLISEKEKGLPCPNIGINFHGYEMFQKTIGVKSKLQQFLLKPFVKNINLKSDVVFSYGGKITSIIQSLGVNNNHIIELESGIENVLISDSISKQTNPIMRFVFMGRSEKRKGIKELNTAIRFLIEKNSAFTFEFIGPIATNDKIQDSRITYHGEVRSFEKIQHLLRQNDVLVCPSYSEGFPNAILEAMACGLAIVATDVGAVSKLVNNNNGWLIKPLEQKELTDALQQVIACKNIDSKKQASLDLIKNHFNWDIISTHLITILNKLVK
jgi:glycosyltransferase involved in cell wall biosynthesis